MAWLPRSVRRLPWQATVGSVACLATWGGATAACSALDSTREVVAVSGVSLQAEVLCGRTAAGHVLDAASEAAARLQSQYQVTPQLAVVMYNSDEDDHAYASAVTRAAERGGVRVSIQEISGGDEHARRSALQSTISRLNRDTSTHGVLVMGPAPASCWSLLSPRKDVEGRHPYHASSLYLNRRKAFPDSQDSAHREVIPCTAEAVMHLLSLSQTALDGSHAVIIGRSDVVGLPVAMLLLRRNATVTVVHSHTPRSALQSLLRSADIVVACCGQPELVQGSWVKPGATVVDVGFHVVPEGEAGGGIRLCGDVRADEVGRVASHLTPVPGGVGPLTTAFVVRNTVLCAADIAEITALRSIRVGRAT